MAMNKQRKISDLANVVVTDASNNVTLPNNLTINALISAGLIKADGTGKLVAATAGTDYVTGNIYTTDGTLTSNRTVTMGGYNLQFYGTGSHVSLRAATATDSSDIIFYSSTYPYGFRIGMYGGSFGSGMSDKASIHMMSKDLYFTQSSSATPSSADITLAMFQATKNITIGGTTDAGYKLDVQGTGRFTGNVLVSSATTGSSGIALDISDTNATVGSIIRNTYSTTSFIVKTIISGTTISDSSRTFMAFSSGSNKLFIGGSSDLTLTGQIGVNAICNSDISNGSGLAIYDSGGQIGQGSGLNFFSGQANRATSAIWQSYGASFTNVDMKFMVSSSATLSEAMRIFGSSKNVIIGGTTDAGYKLDVQGTGRFTGNLAVVVNTFGVGGYSVTNGSTTGIAASDVINNSGTTGFFRSYGIAFGSGTYSELTDIVGFGSSKSIKIFTDASVLNGGTNSIQFMAGGYNNDQERARIGTYGMLIGTKTSVASSILTLASTTQGFLEPRMTGAQIEAIATPAEGLEAYATSAGSGAITSKGWWGYDGTTWVKINGSGGGSGTVTTVSVVSANGFAGTVATATTTPAITISTTITGLLKGNGTAISAATAGTDYQAPITLTTTGSSGASTFVSNTLNIPTYTLAGLGGFSNPMTTLGDIIYGGVSGAATRLGGNITSTKNVLLSTGSAGAATAPVWGTLSASDVGAQASSTNLTSLSGLTFVSTSFVKMTAAGTFSLDTNTYLTSAITSLNGLSVASQTFATGTTGTDFNISSTTSTHTFNLPTASSTNRGALSSSDWSTFNGKQSTITLTTTGSSGAATFVTNTLNIPTYTLAGLGGVSGSGTTNYITKFTGTSAIGNSLLFDNGTTIGIGTTTPSASYVFDIRTPAANTGVIIQSLNSSTAGSNPLTITSDDTWQTIFKVGNTTTREYHLGVGGSSNTGVGASNFGIFDGVALAYRFVITSNGRVLIGSTTDAGAYALQVTGVIKQTSVTSSLLKTDSVGALVAAVSNTDYLAVASPTYTGVLKTGTLGYTATNHMASLQSSVNAYNQFVVQNTNTGTVASSDIVVNNNLSTDTTFYGDFGINGSGFTGSGSFNLPSATYLASSDGDLVLGTYTSNVIRFVVNSGATDAAYISTAGNWMVGQSTDAGYKADINGTLRVVNGIVIGANTATVSALDFTTASAVLKTSPVDGDMEIDSAGQLYYTHATSARGVVDSEQFISLTTAYTLTSQTAAQKMFNSTTNGALNAKAATSYYFECVFSLSSMSTTSGSFGFAIGGTATLTSILWQSTANKNNAAQATAATSQSTFNTTAANTAITSAAATQSTGYARCWGIIRVNAAGTIIPQVSLGVAAAAIVGTNSYFRMWAIGTNTVTNIGNWS